MMNYFSTELMTPRCLRTYEW